MTSHKRIILHVVYIHGFRGDHTTFQSFPTDLHNALQPTIPPHVELHSILYPTYKTKRPIAVATEKFLQWLETLPEGPVILCGHSMGGLLAAEAATSPINAVSKRVVALLAYDVPFLGMHPHVVVSGIASLLPNQKREKEGKGSINRGGSELKTEKEMNDATHVDIAPPPQSRSPSPNMSQTSLSPPDSRATSMSSGPSLSTPPLPPRPSSSTQTQPRDAQPSPLLTPAFISRTLDFLQSHADDRVVNFISKHRSEPFAAATRWVVESLEFGICMFDPQGLRDRYAALEQWQGSWIAFWTETVPPNGDGHEKQVKEKSDVKNGDEERTSKTEQETDESLESLVEIASTTDILSPSQSFPHSPSPIQSFEVTVEAPVWGPLTKSEDKAVKKQAKVDQKKHDKDIKSQAKADRNRRQAEYKALQKHRNTQSPHHFVMLPFRSTHRWEQVKIHGAKDEVEAHCGLFLKDINLQYEDFIWRVAQVTKGWVDNLVT